MTNNMSIRVTFLFIVVLIFFIYAWKDWFKSLCCLIVMMAFLEHPDMPKNIMGIQGLNPWNFLMTGVLLAWFVQRRQEECVINMPKGVKILLGIYFLIILFSVLRMIVNPSNLWAYKYQRSKLISEFFINTFKWVIPGLLIFYGCRTRNRAKLVLLALLIMGFVLAIQVIRKIPAGYAISGTASHRRLKIQREIGYHSVDLSTILAGISWGMIAVVGLFNKRSSKVLILLSVGLVVFAQALTGGRAGFLAWGFTGLTLCFLKWRKYLLLAPIVVMLFIIVLPGATNRMLEGFRVINIAGDNAIDRKAITSGRSNVWPYVIEEIGKSPIVGYGRLAYIRTDLRMLVFSQSGEIVSHPHNAYLEWLLDNGLIGFLPVMVFYLVIIIYATKLFRDTTDTLYAAIGGLTLAFVMAQLIGSIGAQSFYPREGTMAMWCAIGLTLRMTVEKLKMKAVVFNQHYQYNHLQTLPQAAIYSNPQ